MELVEVGRGLGDDGAQAGFDGRRVFFGNHAPVDLEQHLARDHVGIGAAFDAPDVEVRVGDARHGGGDPLVPGVLGVQGVHQRHGRLQCVHAGVGHGRMGHLAVHRDLHLQAAIVGRDHFVAEARSDHS
ncbi:hypothetical protein D3C78_1286500 [compost metagenome]